MYDNKKATFKGNNVTELILISSNLSTQTSLISKEETKVPLEFYCPPLT